MSEMGVLNDRLRDMARVKKPSQEEIEKRIDEFLAGWGGLKESRDYARACLEDAYWDVALAKKKYWHEVILMCDHDT